MVRQVKNLGSELERLILRDGKRLGQADVERKNSRTLDAVAAVVPVGPIRRCGEGTRVQPLVGTLVGSEYVGRQLVRSLYVLVRVRAVAFASDIEKAAGQELENARDPPTAGQRLKCGIGELRCLIHERLVEAVPLVQIAVAAVSPAPADVRSPITGGIESGLIADAVGPGVIRADVHAGTGMMGAVFVEG